MATARSIINAALRKLGIGADGETLTASQASDGLEDLNRLLGSWSTSVLIVPYETTETLTVATSPITLTTRPMSIVGGTLRDGTTDSDVVALTKDQYWALSNKSTTGKPVGLWWDQALTSSKVYLYPVPAVSYTLILHRWDRLANIAALDTEISLPGEYERVIVYNLAIEIAPEYGRSVSAEVGAKANEALDRVTRYNAQEPPPMSTDVVGTIARRFDYGSGGFPRGWMP